jgi:hypothetical protein
MDDLRPLYAASDVVMVASREESLSLVALEGAAQGRPVVCFPGAGGPDMLADEGITHRCEGPGAAAMSDLIVELANSRERRDELGGTAAAAVRQYHDADDARRATATVLQSVITASPNCEPHRGNVLMATSNPFRAGSPLRSTLRRRFPRAREVILAPRRLVTNIRWRRIHRKVSVADRALLEETILPAVRVSTGSLPVLFVGVAWYTADYPAMFPEHGFITIDIDRRNARHGALDHHTIDVRQVATVFGSSAFGAIICNGVFGHGLDDAADIAEAFKAMRHTLRDGGLLVVGWNDTEESRPPPLEALAASSGFVPTPGAGLRSWQQRVGGPMHHVFDVYTTAESKPEPDDG